MIHDHQGMLTILIEKVESETDIQPGIIKKSKKIKKRVKKYLLYGIIIGMRRKSLLGGGRQMDTNEDAR